MNTTPRWAKSQYLAGPSRCRGESNEITAVPALLDLLNIEGAVVTLDAMHCQAKTMAKIIDRKADFVVTVKANQKTLHKEVVTAFNAMGEANYQDRRCKSLRQQEEARGRTEIREVYVMAVPASLRSNAKWSVIKSIGMVYRHREESSKGTRNRPVKESGHVTYFVSLLAPKVKELSRHVREHWSVENRLHRSLDVTFTEDSRRNRKGNSAEVLGGLNRLALTILRRDTSLPKMSLALKRKTTGWNIAALVLNQASRD